MRVWLWILIKEGAKAIVVMVVVISMVFDLPKTPAYDTRATRVIEYACVCRSSFVSYACAVVRSYAFATVYLCM